MGGVVVDEAASITVFRITNGFLVAPSQHGVQVSESIYCKTSEDIGNAVITKFAKQAVAANDPQRDMFSYVTNF